MSTIRRAPAQWKMILDASTDDQRREIFAKNARVKAQFGHLYGRPQIKAGEVTAVRGTLEHPLFLGKAPYRRSRAELITARPTHKHTMSHEIEAAMAVDDAINAGFDVSITDGPTDRYSEPTWTTMEDVEDYEYQEPERLLIRVASLPKPDRSMAKLVRLAAADVPSITTPAISITARLPRHNLNRLFTKLEPLAD